MNVTGINNPAKNPVSVNQNMQDSYEKDIQQQISRLQEKMEDLDSNTEISSEQKAKAKQKIQEQIQNLNKQLRQHQIEKQQKAAEQQEAANKSSAKEESVASQPTESVSGMGSVESGVMVTLSSTDQQMDHLRGIRTDLQGKLRTAGSEEEKAEIQKKINNISHHMGKTIKRSTDTISDYRKMDQDNREKNQPASNNKSRQEQNVLLKNRDGMVRMSSERDQKDKVIYPSFEQNRNNRNHFYVKAQ